MFNGINNKDRTKIRVLSLIICVVIVFLLIANLFKIQLIDGEKYQTMAITQQLREIEIEPHRGSIYDTNMKMLAQSATVWNVIFEPANLSKNEERAQEQIRLLSRGEGLVTLKQEEIQKSGPNDQSLAEILGVEPELIEEKAERRNSYYEVLKKRVDRATYERVVKFIQDNNVTTVSLVETTRRYYPYNNLASTVLGFVNDMNQGAYGLESYYNSVLSGTSGRLVAARNGLSGDMPFEYQKLYEGSDGNSLVLTIDATIQQFLEKHLEIAVVEHDVQKWATGIVMNVNTGEILAMASKPDFNPNSPMEVTDPKALERLSGLDEEEYGTQLAKEQQTLWRNKCISDPYEPGSVFKLVTASASLDTGAATLNSSYQCPGYWMVAGNKIHCWKHAGHGNLSFAEAIQRSCNPAFMQMGQALGVTNFSKYFDSFGLTEITGIDLPGEAASLYHAEEDMGIAELSSSAFGQTFKITPLQMITAASAVVNGGYLMQPYVVKQIVDSDKNIIESYEPKVKRQVISEETSEIMRQMGELVVSTDEGSGRNARIEGYRIGGKTGTGEKLDNYVDGKQVIEYVLSFFAFLPADDPEYAVLITLDEPVVGDAQSSTIAVPVVAALLEDIIPYLGIEPSYSESDEEENETVMVPYLIDEKPHEAQISLRALGLNTEIIGNGATVLKQIPENPTRLPKGGTVILYTDDTVVNSTTTVPNVIGKTAQEANQMILNAGLNIRIEGQELEGAKTVVVAQEPAGDSTAEIGSIVTIHFVEPEPKAEE